VCVCVCDESIVQSMAYLTWYTTFLFCYFNFYLLLGIFLICVVCTDWFIFGIEYCALSKQPLVLFICYAFTNPVDGVGDSNFWVVHTSLHLNVHASEQRVKARVANLHKWGLAQPPSCDCGQWQTTNHIVDTCTLTKIWIQTESIPCNHMAGVYSTREINK